VLKPEPIRARRYPNLPEDPLRRFAIQGRMRAYSVRDSEQMQENTFGFSEKSG